MQVVRYIIFSLLVFLVVECSGQLKIYKIEELENLEQVAPKPVLVFMYADWCVYCKQMRWTTFKNKQLIEILNRDFYFVAFNGEEKNSILFKNKTYQYQPTGTGTGFHNLVFALGMDRQDMGYPSISLMNSDLRVTDNTSGYLSAKELIRAIGNLQRKN